MGVSIESGVEPLLVAEIVLGVINALGRAIPVADVRRRFRLPAREIHLDGRFIIGRTTRRIVEADPRRLRCGSQLLMGDS